MGKPKARAKTTLFEDLESSPFDIEKAEVQLQEGTMDAAMAASMTNSECSDETVVLVVRRRAYSDLQGATRTTVALLRNDVLVHTVHPVSVAYETFEVNKALRAAVRLFKKLRRGC